MSWGATTGARGSEACDGTKRGVGVGTVSEGGPRGVGVFSSSSSK